MYHQKTIEAAKGKWRGILLELGVPDAALKDRHGPCPMCGGTDRFRWDNQDGRGTYICNQCGAGDGMKLAEQYTGQDFRDVARRIDLMLGNVKPDDTQPKREMSTEDRRRMLRELWGASRPVQKGDLVDTYLAARGLDEPAYHHTLRFAPAIRDGEGGTRPAMLAAVGVYGAERFTSIHRTFLRPDGRAKAEMAFPRKMTPGELPAGACVPLSDYTGGPLGIAEGIETAFAASAMYEMPVWSAISANLLRNWWPPEGCEEVVIFGDCDPKMGGQAAAFHLAHRLAVKGIEVQVKIPEQLGTDWADVYADWKRRAA